MLLRHLGRFLLMLPALVLLAGCAGHKMSMTEYDQWAQRNHDENFQQQLQH